MANEENKTSGVSKVSGADQEIKVGDETRMARAVKLLNELKPIPQADFWKHSEQAELVLNNLADLVARATSMEDAISIIQSWDKGVPRTHVSPAQALQPVVESLVQLGKEGRDILLKHIRNNDLLSKYENDSLVLITGMGESPFLNLRGLVFSHEMGDAPEQLDEITVAWRGASHWFDYLKEKDNMSDERQDAVEELTREGIKVMLLALKEYLGLES